MPFGGVCFIGLILVPFTVTMSRKSSVTQTSQADLPMGIAKARAEGVTVPVVLGGSVTEANVVEALADANAAIVSTALMRKGTGDGELCGGTQVSSDGSSRRRHSASIVERCAFADHAIGSHRFWKWRIIARRARNDRLGRDGSVLRR